MAVRENPFASRASRIVLALTVATSLCAAVAAAPSAPMSKEDEAAATRVKTTIGEDANGLRPLGHGPAIRVGRAYDAEDEDCTLAVTQFTDPSGHVRVTHAVACAN